MQPLPHWNYLKLGEGRKALYTCVLSEVELEYPDLRRLGLSLHQSVELLAAAQISFEAAMELAAACAFLYPDDLCEGDLGFRFGLYTKDVLGLAASRPRLAGPVIAKVIADAVIQLAATTSSLFPTRQT